jgi:hypothetical protein
MAFTQVASTGLSIFAGNNGQLAMAYAAEQSNCQQVGVMQQQVQQLNDLTRQAKSAMAQGPQLSAKLRQLRASTLVYAQSIGDEQRRFRTRAAIAIILNIYVTLMLIFMILRKTQRRHGSLSHAELDLSILEAARRDAALAASLETPAATSA